VRTTFQTYKIDADNQLRFAPSCAFDFDGLRSTPVRCQRRLGHPTVYAVLGVSSSIAWRLSISASESGMSLRVAPSIDRRRVMRNLLLLRRRKWTLRPRRIRIVGVAWGPAKAVGLLIHRETGGGGGAPCWRVEDTGSGGGLKIGGWGSRGLTISVTVSAGLSLGTKGSTELFESGGHGVDGDRMKGEALKADEERLMSRPR